VEGASPTRIATCSSPETIFVFVGFADLRFPALLALQERLRGPFGIFSAVLLKEGLAVYPPPAMGGATGATEMLRGGLELELIHPHMAQKPVLRGEAGCACVAREVSVERGVMGERGCARRLGGWVWV